MNNSNILEEIYSYIQRKAYNTQTGDLVLSALSTPRKGVHKGRKKRRSAILTDTPELKIIEEESLKKKQKEKQQPAPRRKRQRNEGGKQKRQKKTKAIAVIEEDSSDDDDYFCLVCLESYANSKPNESWIQCINCKLWSHEECTDGSSVYICQNCESDDDLF
ncbi:uncharacterized protein [Argopecten irradians]|uniref:uncharacterized protein n=1 Tax=Argopecten irradians TaxID=31199 RepID=UPI0037161C21